MNIRFSEKTLWMALFFGLILGYCLFYAPFGVNETDGGFLTGLAWQLLNGKILYQDIIYVRPPLPVWLRSLELQYLPEQFGILGERWIFYLKLGLYSWLGAAVLETGKRRWLLATFGFVVSAHCYPAMAWHTVDGILFAVLSVYLFLLSTRRIGFVWAALGGVALFAAILCKQSFYPLILIIGGGVWFLNWRKAIGFSIGLIAAMSLFVKYLQLNQLLENYLQLTNGAAASGQAIQHGLLDYGRITPELALPSISLALLGYWLYRNNKASKWPNLLWQFWLLALVLSFAAITWMRQEHTVPFAQTRALFWVAVAVLVWRWQDAKNGETYPDKYGPQRTLVAALLLGISWSAAISWGYNLPVLFSTPLVWAAMQVSGNLSTEPKKIQNWRTLALLMLLVAAFRVGFEFVYRDAERSAMTTDLGLVFPKLSGVYSSPETAALYQDLKRLSEKYGPDFTVLPAFPQANYLTGTRPPLPLDWVVNRETNGDNELIYKEIRQLKPLIFIEKEYLKKIESGLELSLTKELLNRGALMEESAFFMVISTHNF